MKKKIKKVVYAPVVGDLFNFGHLKFLLFIRSLGDYLICGVMTDDAVAAYKQRPMANLAERRPIFENLVFVDRVMVQDSTETEKNLKKIKLEFKNSEIVVVYGSNWKTCSSHSYIKSNDMKVIQYPDFYGKFSDREIVRHLLENYRKEFKDHLEFSEYFNLGDFIRGDAEERERFLISTKADTLKALKPLLKKSKIEDHFVFTCAQWKRNESAVISRINRKFFPDKIIVRSSALNEDSARSSMAGVFDSVLDVDSGSSADIKKAVLKVLNSYRAAKSLSSKNQILVQKQTTNIKISGVVFTRSIETNSPYYVINYDDITGSSDSVTKGHRHKMIKIYRFANSRSCPDLFKPVMDAVREIEEIVQKMSLDIEFAVNKKGETIIFQVRPLAANSGQNYLDNIKTKKVVEHLKKEFEELAKPRSHLAGLTTYLADMPDWNPAEIIGDRPNYLDYSLYDYILTDSAWHKARTSQGYYNVNPAKLVVMFANKPYVDVRNSFNSFVPAVIGKNLREKLVNFYLKKLKDHPELQDKVEFEIALTCYDFKLDEKLNELETNGFTKQETSEIARSLRLLTNNLIKRYPISVKNDLKSVVGLASLRNGLVGRTCGSTGDPCILVSHVQELLDECLERGTVQFSRLARLAFIGKIMLKSLVAEGVLNRDDYERFFSSIETVATKMNEDFSLFTAGLIGKKEFLNRYGHLRPGSYDITSPRYDSNTDILSDPYIKFKKYKKETAFVLDKKTGEKIDGLFSRHGFTFGAGHFFKFIRSALEAREFSKFEFTKNLSAALECIAKAGLVLGFSRADMSNLDVENIFNILHLNKTVKIKSAWSDVIQHRRQEAEGNKKVILPPIVYSAGDLDIIVPYTAKPNFITQKSVKGRVINLNKHGHGASPDIRNKIVILENGDPGYDWIFTRKPLALITKYGGVASHMSIRCAEFGLPAAIGCGESIFGRLRDAKSIFLDCAKTKILPL